MISNQTIFIAHSWSDVSLNLQSKALALGFSANNNVVFLNARKTGKATERINGNLVIYNWPGKRPVGWKDFWFAVKLMKQYTPDIIITNFAANDIMLFVSWLFRVKYRVSYFHTMVQQHIADHKMLGLRQRINIFRKGFVFRLATHMLPSTAAAKKDLVKYYKVDKNKAFVFPNALPDTDARNKGDLRTIGFLGRLDRSKGVDILITAFKNVSDQFNDVQLVIAGTGSQERELKKQVENAGLAGKVKFKGAIAYDEVRCFLVSVNFLVVPSRMDNLPTVVLEAFSVATPVIGSNAGGIPDMIKPGYNGLLFENGNAEELSQRMIQLIANEEKRNNMSWNARKTFEEKYCIDNLLSKFEALIEAKPQSFLE